jgi:hypothetical protein
MSAAERIEGALDREWIYEIRVSVAAMEYGAWNSQSVGHDS